MTWRTIASTETDTNSPITQALMDALRLNPAAIANGDAGAPRIQTAAYAGLSITNETIADLTIGAEKLQAGTEETIWVLLRTAQGVANQIGSYVFAEGSAANYNDTRAGSVLFPSSTSGSPSVTALSGTWRCMGDASTATAATLWLRVS